MTDQNTSNKPDTIHRKAVYGQLEFSELQKTTEQLILQWRLGHFNTLEDIWLNMQELQFRMGKHNDGLRKRLNEVMHEVAEALWHKYQDEQM